MFEIVEKAETVHNILLRKGATLHTKNVNIQRDPDYGLMLVATDTIKAGELILDGDMASALEIEQVQHSIGQLSTETLSTKASIHCHFAVLLTLQLTPEQNSSLWNIPDINNYKKSFHIFCTDDEFSSLDEDTKDCLDMQWVQLIEDWEYAKGICQLNLECSEALKGPRGSKEDMFLRSWFYIESKAYVDPRETYVPWSADTGPSDCQVLFPVADYLSFGPNGCTVEFKGGRYWFTTGKEYEKGDKIDLQREYDNCGPLTPSGVIMHNMYCDPDRLSSRGRLSPIEEERSPTSQASFVEESWRQ